MRVWSITGSRRAGRTSAARWALTISFAIEVSFPYVVSFSLGGLYSGPERPDTEKGCVLHPSHCPLPPKRSRVFAVGHAEDKAPLAFEDRRHFVLHAGALEDDYRVRWCADPDLTPANPRIENGVTEAARSASLVVDGDEHREVPAPVEIVVEVPADMVAWFVVEQ